MPRTSTRKTPAAGNRSVAIIVTVRDHAPFLVEALKSCMQQTVQPTEVLVVDAGPHDRADLLAATFPRLVVHRLLSASRSSIQSAGLAKVFSEFTVFLEADERLTRSAIQAGLQCFDKNPDAWFALGAHRVIDSAGRPASPDWHERLNPQLSIASFCRGNGIAMQAAVMYRTERLRSLVGSEGNREVHKECGIDFSNAYGGRIATHDCCVAEYRCQKRLMLARSIAGLQLDENQSRDAENAERLGRRLLFQHNASQIFANSAKELIAKGWSSDPAKLLLRAAWVAPLALFKALMSRGLNIIMRRLPRSIGRLFGEALWAPDVGRARFGDFGRTKPISADYGLDRGGAVDRYYIEQALKNHCELVRGRVLEVAARDYTRSFGAERVVRSDVLDIDPLNPLATIVGDLGVVGSLPEGAFDCIVLTQTLQLIYNLDNAVENLHRALAPGGTLLISVPGISPIGRDEIRYWYWAFTELSLKTLLSSRFGESNVEMQSYGNVFAAICFLTGLSLKEVETEKLDYKDASYPVIVFACARKPH